MTRRRELKPLKRKIFTLFMDEYRELEDYYSPRGISMSKLIRTLMSRQLLRLRSRRAEIEGELEDLRSLPDA